MYPIQSACSFPVDRRTKENILPSVASARLFSDMSLPNPQSDADQLEAATDHAITACGGDAREAVKALIVANAFLETELEKMRAKVSPGYAPIAAA